VADQASHPILERQAPTSSLVSSHVSRVWWCWSLFVLLLQRLRQPSELSIHLCSCLLVRGNMSCVHEFIFRREPRGWQFGFLLQLRLIFVCLLYCAVSSLNRSMCRPDVLCSSLSTASCYFVSMTYWMRRSLAITMA
jgi:hypothetical protein